MPEETRNLPAVTTRTPATMINLTTAPEEGVPTTQNDKFPVILVRAGKGGKKYMCPKGSTVEDLARAANASLENQDIVVGEEKVNKDFVLGGRCFVFLTPLPKNA
jgi:hypothetical protein